jgi:hypothetical protein
MSSNFQIPPIAPQKPNQFLVPHLQRKTDFFRFVEAQSFSSSQHSNPSFQPQKVIQWNHQIYPMINFPHHFPSSINRQASMRRSEAAVRKAWSCDFPAGTADVLDQR